MEIVAPCRLISRPRGDSSMFDQRFAPA